MAASPVLVSGHIGRQQPSLFAAPTRVPSSALIEKALRDIADEPGAVLDEHTVDGLCEKLVESARLLSEFPLTTNPVDRAESFRYLLTMVAYAVDAALLNADPLEPMFSQPYRLHLLDWGGASPDSVYRRAMVRDDCMYRVHGRLGNAQYLSIDFRQGSPARTLVRADLDAGADGEFEIFLGGAPPDASGAHWWPFSEGTSGLVVREFFDDWQTAERSRLRIDCLDGEPAPRPEHNRTRVATEFDFVGEWVLEGAIRYWIDQSTPLARNARNGFLPDLLRTDTKLPVTTFGWWELQPDEALIVELQDPDADFWGLHLVTSLWHTLDYANRITTFNLAQADQDPDGMFRFVISADDPGVHNWLDTTGLERGVIIVRFCGARSAVSPRARVVARSEVVSEVPTARACTPEERRAQIAERRDGVAHMILD